MSEKDNKSENVNDANADIAEDIESTEDETEVSDGVEMEALNDSNIESEAQESEEQDLEEQDSEDEQPLSAESENLDADSSEAESEESEDKETDDADAVEEKKVSVPLTDDKLKNILEAALMAMGKPMSVEQLMRLFEGEETPSAARVKDALKLLQEECEGRGIELKEIATGYRYQSRQDYSDWISRLYEERPAKYSRAYLETLALIAYRQPVTRAEIEEVRGVSVSSYIMKTMLEREWIRVVGHRDVPGRPSLYATTKQFLDYFNMKSLDELPSLAEIKDLDDLNPELALEEPNGEISVDAESSDGESFENEAIDAEVTDDRLIEEDAESFDEEINARESSGTYGENLEDAADLDNDNAEDESVEDESVEDESVEDEFVEDESVNDEIIESQVAENYVQENLQEDSMQMSDEDNPDSRPSAFSPESNESFDDEIESDTEANIIENTIDDFLTEPSASDENSEEMPKSRSQEEQE